MCKKSACPVDKDALGDTGGGVITLEKVIVTTPGADNMKAFSQWDLYEQGTRENSEKTTNWKNMSNYVILSLYGKYEGV